MIDYQALHIRQKLMLWGSAFTSVPHFTVTVESLFNNEYNPYPKKSLKRSLVCNWAILFVCFCR